MQTSLYEKALNFARIAHSGQTRLTGDDFIKHPIQVSQKLKEMRIDEKAIVAALLHNVIVDTDFTLSDIEIIFGEEIKRYVEILSREDLDSPEETMEKYLSKLREGVEIEKNIYLIKLFDTLHNLETLDSFIEQKKQDHVQEVKDHYLPLFYDYVESMDKKHQCTCIESIKQIENICEKVLQAQQ